MQLTGRLSAWAGLNERSATEEFAALEQDVSRLLDDLGAVEPPAGLSRDIMRLWHAA